MLIGRDARIRLASISFVALFGVLAVGCGDDIPAEHDGGTGGSGGKGGDAGMDTKDADAQPDLGEAGDVNGDRPDLGETGDVVGDHPETGDVAGDMAGDMAGDTGEVAHACFMVSFDQPKDLATLTAADDKDADNCANGFQYDVKISSADAPDGTDVNLLANNVMLASAKVTGGKATFTGVQLASSGDTQLSIQFPGTAPCTAATTKAKVTVSCKVPSCTISKPSHTTLNGIPVAQGGDRASATGSSFQAAFEVTTDIDDGRQVALKIDNVAAPATITTVTANATGGKATFAGVTLSPDAKYEVVAQCTDKNGVVGSSMKATFTVDTTPPDLTISAPQNGQFFGPGDLTNGAFKVCGQTTATDAVAIPPSVGALANNLCIAGTNNCVAVSAVSTDACVNVTCPGGAPFDIAVNLNDAAGNVTSKTITGISCASTLPSVRIVAPVGDAPAFADVSKRLLSAGATGANQLKDLDANTPGAQANVVACSDRAGMAQLLVGLAGGGLAPLGSAVATVAAVMADNCPAGFGFVAKFNGVTLPESTESATGTITAATELRVDLTDLSTAKGSSAVTDIWVDTVAPVISLLSPGGLCGSFQQTAGTFTTDVAVSSDTANVLLTVTNGASTDTRTNPTFAGGVATFTAVAFDQGQNNLAAVATDAAGNATTFAPTPCTITVGGAPVVTFTAPTATQMLCPNGSAVANCIADNDAGTPGWQGSVTVHVTVGGVPLGSTNVTFTIGATTLGTAMLDVNGNATLAITTNVVPEGASVTFTATTDDVPAHGVGVGTVTVNVDTLPPGDPTNIKADHVAALRRQTGFQLSWTAPDDNGRNVAGYDIRVAKAPIDATNFNGATSLIVPFSGMPGASGTTETITVTNLNIEQDYYFAVRAFDAAGGTSNIDSTATAIREGFLVTTLTGVGATDNSGYDVDGTGDFGSTDLSFTNDGLSDLIVGANNGKAVYMFFGDVGGYSTTPSITFTGATSGFGKAVADIGDIDGDGLNDIAISSPADGNGKVFIYSRLNHPVSWGTTTSWPAALSDTQANYIVSGDATLMGAMYVRGLARVGNFDSSGPDDLAISFALSTGNIGKIYVLKGSAALPASLTLDNVNSVEIDGVVPAGALGFPMLGIGQFFANPAGPTLLASATLTGTVYAFAGQAPVGGIITAAMANQSVVGSVASDRYGASIGYLGSAAVTIGSTAGKYIDVHRGSPPTGPFQVSGNNPAPAIHITNSASGNSFGVINFGSAIKGTTGVVSIVGGDSIADLVVAGQAEVGTPIYILNGANIPTLASSIDLSTTSTAVVPPVVKVTGRMPIDWAGYTVGTVIPDLNGDGYGDFAVGEFTTAKSGRVVVFY